MNVEELITILELVEDKTLQVRIVPHDSEDEENYWVGRVEASGKGASGYEMDGEVRVIGYE